MPGIAGITASSDDTSALNDIEPMVRVMKHDPLAVSGHLAFADRGLAVGWVVHPGSFSDALPVWNEDRTVCLILAGEEYSASGQRGQLQRLGHDVPGDNVSTLVHLYEEHGPDFLRLLNGRFAGLLVDHGRNIAILFNDRFGLGRIYVHQRPDALYFASEAKALLALFPELRELDQRGLAEFHAVGCVLQDRSLFKGISLLPPGSQWTFHRDGRVDRARYFQPADWEQQEPLGEKAYREQLQEVFSRVAPRYLQGNLPLGMSLTGGLDSRMLLAWSPQPPGGLPCYTFGGPYRDCWDVRIARDLAKVAGQSHSTIRIEEDFFTSFRQLAEQAVYLSDGTMDVTGAVELYANRKARATAPVRLTGNYGSEILRSNVAFRPGKLDRSLFTPEFNRLLDEAGDTYHEEAAGSRLSFIAFKQVPWHHYGRFSIEQSQLTPRSPFLDNDLVQLAYRVPQDTATSPQRLLSLISAGNSRLDRVRTDRSLTRHPLPVISSLAQKWQEFTAKAEYAYDYGMPRRLVQVDRMLKPLGLERLFLGRHKFYHFRTWYKGALRQFVQSAAESPEPGFYRDGAARNLIRDHISGRANRTLELHKLLTVQI
ncbi:MAG TPA: asparagine synthase-related protein, partial [Chthoniobacteraceae bacterium]|nr:asparagine synthase-related protein [Chthoniobacteraceae bacterium]